MVVGQAGSRPSVILRPPSDRLSSSSAIREAQRDAIRDKAKEINEMLLDLIGQFMTVLSWNPINPDPNNWEGFGSGPFSLAIWRFDRCRLQGQA